MQKNIYKRRRIYAWGVIVGISTISFFISEIPLLKSLAISPLIIAVIFGSVYGNTAKIGTKILYKTKSIAISTKQILRLGIILYGFRITFSDIAFVGVNGILMAFVMVFSTFFVGFLIGKALGLDTKSTTLISSGSSICGAAAVLATESMTKGGSSRVGVAVTTVVVFGTITMFIYPFVFKIGVLPFSQKEIGFFLGGTLHEVAHAVGAGAAVGGMSEQISIIIKMLRVLMLMPFLILLSFLNKNKEHSIKDSIPYFAIWFIVAVVVGSVMPFRTEIIPYINFLDTFMLTIAMVGLGIGIRKDIFKSAGKKPFILAFGLLLWLILFGGVASKILG
ncbi:YeiH family protein [Campylobacter corcagiensis]|uniref:YeiH family protein n=1 Tax=Campylobacter corcagiensis TaxID=1448857 RepID=UPI0004B7880B|nr:putative sulfate exporter family transporter [Campylobacter corcagiensis]QKF63968.1 YeiH/YadS family membrane protein [Campylobacter corcagiensis]